MEDILSINKERVEKRVNAAVETVKKHFEVEEIPVDDKLNNFTINKCIYVCHQYEIKDVGNMLTMATVNNPELMMDTILINPYFKQAPLFSSDHLYIHEDRKALNEIYDTVDKEFITDTYLKHINKMKENAAPYEHIEDLPVHHCWYERIRPVYVAKRPTPEQDDDMYKLYFLELNEFIDMLKDIPLIDTKEGYENKWLQNKNYSDGLLKDAGEATELFQKYLGDNFTTDFFDYVFFAPETFKDKFNK